MTKYREMVIKIPEEIISFVNLNGFLPKNYRNAMGRILLDGIELPKEHGDLIDRDKLLNKLEKLEWIRTNYSYDEDNTNILEDIIDEVPKIIEANIEESN